MIKGLSDNDSPLVLFVIKTTPGYAGRKRKLLVRGEVDKKRYNLFYLLHLFFVSIAINGTVISSSVRPA